MRRLRRVRKPRATTKRVEQPPAQVDTTDDSGPAVVDFGGGDDDDDAPAVVVHFDTLPPDYLATRRDDAPSQDSGLMAGAGLLWTPPAWRCKYGCGGVQLAWRDEPEHAWNCPHWTREGNEETPFD